MTGPVGVIGHNTLGQAYTSYKPLLAVRYPYITVDRMTYDLTAYSSQTSTGSPGSDPIATNTPTVGVRYSATRERGTLEYTECTRPSTAYPSNYVPKYLAERFPENPTNGKRGLADIPAWEEAVNPSAGAGWLYSLGYLNRRFGNPIPTGAGNMYGTTYGPEYVGDPQYPFPWLAWANRPFISHHESAARAHVGPLGSCSIRSFCATRASPPPIRVARSPTPI